MTISYELAKKLKDAGWPQNITGGGRIADIKLSDTPYGTLVDRGDIICAKPTLSELIEACGQDFSELVLTDAYSEKAGIKTMWQAYMSEEAFAKTGIDCVRECDGYEIGSTPEEAVARLWLALNTNSNVQ